MDELWILGGAAALLLFWKGGGTASVTVAANAPAPASTVLATPISISGGAKIPGGYLIPPAGGTLAPGVTGPVTPAGLPSNFAPPPAPAPPPAVVGGVAGNAGTGGIPLGAFRIGLGPLTSTTVPNRGGWLVKHRLPNAGFGRVPGLSRVPVRFA